MAASSGLCSSVSTRYQPSPSWLTLIAVYTSEASCYNSVPTLKPKECTPPARDPTGMCGARFSHISYHWPTPLGLSVTSFSSCAFTPHWPKFYNHPPLLCVSLREHSACKREHADSQDHCSCQGIHRFPWPFLLALVLTTICVSTTDPHHYTGTCR